jgi:hypothetical protein
MITFLPGGDRTMLMLEEEFLLRAPGELDDDDYEDDDDFEDDDFEDDDDYEDDDDFEDDDDYEDDEDDI